MTTKHANQPAGTRTSFAFATAMNLQPHLAIWVIYLIDFRDITLAQIALMEGIFWAITMVLELPTGAISDRFGRRTAFLLATSIEGAAALAFGFAGSYEMLVFSYVLWGASTALQSGSVEAFLYDRLVTDGATDDYPRLAGRMNAVMTGAFIVGGVSSGVIAAAADLQAAVLVAAVPYAVAFVFALRLSEPPHPSAKSAETSYLGTLAGAMRSLRDVPTVRWLILFQTTLSLVMVANFMFLQPFLSEYGVSVALFGILAIPIMLSRIGGGIFSHRLLDALGLRSLLVSGLLLTVAGMAIMGIIPHISAFTGLALATLAAAAINPAADGYIHDRVTSEVRATVMSVMPMGRLCFFALSIPLLGIAADANIAFAFLAIGTFVAAASGTALALWHLADGRDPNVGCQDGDTEILVAAGGQ